MAGEEGRDGWEREAMAWRAERKRWLQPSEEGRERPERKSARSQAKLDALEITKQKIEP